MWLWSSLKIICSSKKKSIGRGDCSLLACCHLVAAAGVAQRLGEAKNCCCCCLGQLPRALLSSGDSQYSVTLELFPSVSINPSYPSGHSLNHGSARLSLSNYSTHSLHHPPWTLHYIGPLERGRGGGAAVGIGSKKVWACHVALGALKSIMPRAPTIFKGRQNDVWILKIKSVTGFQIRKLQNNNN